MILKLLNIEKIKIISRGILFFLIAISSQGVSQTYVNELKNYDSTYSKEIVVPFNCSKTGEEITPPPLDQIIFYTPNDQFSYWYKVFAKEDTVIGFKVDPIDNLDHYMIFVYQYNKNDFCDKVYYQKIQPLKPSFFLNQNGEPGAYDLTQKYMQVKKNNIYYISILNTSVNNCGHFFRLWKGTDTMKVKAIHIPCTRAISIASINIEPVSAISVKCNVTSSKKGTLTEPKLRIVDELTDNEVTVSATNTEEFEFKIERGKNYKVECSVIGYKYFDHSIKISDEIKGSGNRFKIELEPLKAGDNFILKNIYFNPNTYALRKGSEQDLSRLLNYLLANEKIKIEIQGHTNGNNRIYKNKAYRNSGDEWNFSGSAKKLSKMRAETIKKYLILNGVNENRLIAIGYGGDRMIIKNPSTPEEGQENIRVEILILENAQEKVLTQVER